MRRSLFSVFAVCGYTTLAFSVCDPMIALNDSGDAVIVWSEAVWNDKKVYQSIYPHGGTWNSPVVISPSDQEATEPKVQLNNEGNFYAVWRANNGSFYELQLATSIFPDIPEIQTHLSDKHSLLFSVAGDFADTGITIIWQQGTTTLDQELFSGYFYPENQWSISSPVDSRSTFFYTPEIRRNPLNKTALAIWQSSINNELQIRSAYLPWLGFWSTPVTISTLGNDATKPAMAASSSGAMAAIWQVARDSYFELEIRKFIAREWTLPISISIPDGHLRNPQIGINASGTVLIAAEKVTSHSSVIVVYELQPDGSLSDFITLSQEGIAVSPQIQFNDSGQAVVVWTNTVEDSSLIQASIRALGGGWSLPETLSTPGAFSYSPKIVLNSSGYALSVWKTMNGSNCAIESVFLEDISSAWSSIATIFSP